MLADSDSLRLDGKFEGSRNVWDDVRVFDRMYFVGYCVSTNVTLGRFCEVIAHFEGLSHRIF